MPSAIRTIACLVAVLAAAPAVAQDLDPGIVDAQAGRWLVAPEDGGPGCVLTLSKEAAIGGFGVDGAERCTGGVAAVADAAAWNFDDEGVVLIDPLRRVVAKFLENEGDPLRAANGAGPVLDMVPAVDGVDRLPAPSTTKGAWVMRRPGGPVLCTIALGDAPGADDTYPMRIVGDCDPAIAAFDFSVWSISGLGITLMNREGNALRFTATATGFDKDAIEGGKPLILARP